MLLERYAFQTGSANSISVTTRQARTTLEPLSLQQRLDSARIETMSTERTPGEWTILLAGSIGPLGYAPASGTVTVAVIGVPLYWVMHDLSPITYVTVTVLFSLASVAVHQAGDRILGEKDSRRLVWDELVGFMFAVAFVPFTWQLAAVAFFVERAIDVAKIPPARQIEDHWPGGWGVVGDDIAAGLYTCGLLHLLIYLSPTMVGLSG